MPAILALKIKPVTGLELWNIVRKFLIIFPSKKEFQRSCQSRKQKRKLDTTDRGDLSKLLQTEDYDLKSVMELLKDCKDFFKDLKSDTAFNEMLYDARELADEIDIPVNFELTLSRHRVRRRNVNFDYEAQDEI
ncbi:uncharacterized protein TNCV_1537222 [Trichonephila clavipes]|nr:uncharacterized protein TNCV_1537222 [Trichonephila clavipes]